jgi:DNA mismatch repair protein MSH6
MSGKKTKSPPKNLKQGSLFSFFSKQQPPKASATSGKKISNATSAAATSNKQSNQLTKSSSSTSNDGNAAKKSTSAAAAVAATATTASNKKISSTSATRNTKWQKLKAECRIAVYWKDDGKYYACTVVKQHSSADITSSRRSSSTSSNAKSCSQFHLRYDDGEEEEWVDMSLEKFKFIDEDEHLNDEDDDQEKASSNNNNKRRRLTIQESDEDEEENEWKDNNDEEEDDDGSVFDDVEPEEDEEDEDQWMVTDDEDDEDGTGKKKNKKSSKSKSKTTTKVTRHPGPTEEASSATPPAAKRAKTCSANTANTDDSGAISGDFKTPLKSFAHRVSPKTASSHKSTDASTGGTPATGSQLSFSQQQSSSSTPYVSTNSTASSTKSTPNNKPPPFFKGVVNVRGAHVHNHLPFLQNPKDANGRPVDHPEYDCRTLKVVERDWINLMGSPMTDAVQQWWDLKSQYFDTVLLFKTGKFYEMFHMDADVGVELLGFSYMKGHVAHAGFPETAYSKFADILVRAGYKVARVEQTETPEQLKERKNKTSRGNKKPKVVNREVCSIMSLGTRTLCALDNGSGILAEANSNSAAEGMGPLLAIREVLTESNDAMEVGDEDDAIRPVCEYGITMVDAIRGTITLGMFADDVLRSRMSTLLASFAPSEVLIQGGSADQQGASPTLMSLLKAYTNNSRYPCRLETIHQQETFPKSTALQAEHRRQLERPRSVTHPWDVEETLNELHRKRYFPRGSRQAGNKSIARWPPVLQAVVEGEANLCLSSLGAALFFLQRNLIDQEILTMGIIKAYIPQTSPSIQQHASGASQTFAASQATAHERSQDSEGRHESETNGSVTALEGNPLFQVPTGVTASADGENQITYMSLDGTTLHNLEILTNSVDFKVSGSLWSKINHTKSPHGARMLRAWLLRPLFRKNDIDRRADAVQALVGGAGALALREVRQSIFSKIGDLDRLLSRVHSMSGGISIDADREGECDDGMPSDYHPSERAVLYENATYTQRKVGDFSKLLNGLRRSCQIPELFSDMELDPNGQLFKFVRLQRDGGLFPDMVEELDWYFENFDCDKAEKGLYEPVRGCDPIYDQACDTIQRVKEDLVAYQDEMCRELSPRHVAKSSWKYINTKPDSKDKYLIELPVNVDVPADFLVKGKRGSGHKQVNKYTTPVVAELVKELERAYEVQQVRKAKGMQLIFARFDAQRSLWSAAAHVTAVLDAIGSLAIMAENPGYCRAEILECPADKQPSINIVKGRHPVVETSFHSSDFIPNDLRLGPQEYPEDDSARMLLLSGALCHLFSVLFYGCRLPKALTIRFSLFVHFVGPNMGGKSTMLRQTCLIAILAQIGSYVPAQKCQLTPIDCIFTRLGASDRILLGQSTFFVEVRKAPRKHVSGCLPADCMPHSAVLSFI